MHFSSTGLDRRFNVGQYLTELNLQAGRGAKTAFLHRDESLTFQETHELAGRFSGLLGQLEVAPGDRVALLLPDSPDLVISFLGAIRSGALAVAVNTAYSHEDIRHVIGETKASVLVTSREWETKLGELRNETLRTILIVDGPESLRERLSRPEVPSPEPVLTSPGHPAFILYTSGSTGRPKGAVHAHRDLVVSAELYAKNVVGIRESDISFSVARIPYAYGLCSGLVFPMAVGATSVLTTNLMDLVTDIRRFRPTVFWGLPAVYASLISSTLDASSFRLCLSSGEALPSAVGEAWEAQFRRPIYEGIGSTEALGCFIANGPENHRRGTSGRPVAGYDIRVVDERGDPVAPGELGDLVVRGESVMSGYWNRPDETSAMLGPDGSLRTADKYQVDDDGFHRYMGRKDDLFKIAGHWVSPIEIEAALSSHPDVEACAVVPAPTGERGQLEVLAYVMLKPQAAPGSPAKNDEVRRFAKKQLAAHKGPKRIQFTDRLPRNANGKVDRRAIRDAMAKEVREP